MCFAASIVLRSLFALQMRYRGCNWNSMVHTQNIVTFLEYRFVSYFLLKTKTLFCCCCFFLKTVNKQFTIQLEEQGWRSGEGALLPPLWRGFDSRTRHHSLLLVLVLAPKVFLRFLLFSSHHKNQHCKFQFDPEMIATGLSVVLLSVILTK